MKPLEGLRILTVENFGAGPYGTMFLAGLGAEVTKIENAATGGDASRHVGPRLLGEDDSEYFQTFNLWKKTVSLDLTKDRSKFLRLVKGSDGVVNNLRGDVPAKLGLDYRSLSSVNEKIVCLHISAYGRDNERAFWPGYDFLMQAEAGLMDLTGEPEGAPSRFGTSIIDCMSGVTGALALLACVLRAKRTGKGCDVDASLFDVALHQLTYMGTWHLNGGKPSSRQPRSAHYSLTPVQTFPTADGWIFVMCMKESFWSALCEALSRPDLGRDARFATMAARLENRATLTGMLDDEFRRKTTAHWLKALSGRLPVGPVNDLRAALANPFVAATGMVRSIEHPEKRGLRVLTLPVKIDGERPQPVVCEGLKK
ncbi:MAG TPA: CoA transferase [Burkholderiales bacterium]|nr:CoA transferase [Burkholderiales bacterium]